jgi:predicted phosphate transport protein (TIGR00153 family)
VGIKEFFKPRQDKFLESLIKQAEITLEGMVALEAYMKKAAEKHAAAVAQAEKDADEARRILIDDLNHTFVTPMDREDIFALSRAVDDVMDYAYSTVEEMQILEVEPNDFLRRMVSLLHDAANELHLAMLRLRENPGVATEHATRAKALENRVERVYREAIADLFTGPEDIRQVMKMLKLREIYRHLSNCADRGDEAANVIHDIVVNYTRDTIVSAAGTRLVDGGAFNYGAHAATKMGLKVAAITRLAREDWHVVERLARLGVDVLAEATPQSTCLRLEYPTSNPDERVIYVASSAGSFTPAQVAAVQAQAFVFGPSFRGEVGLDVIQTLAGRGARIAADVQGWVRVVRDDRLAFEAWPEARGFLAHVAVVKADAVEAERLTGEADIHRAARLLASLGPSEVALTHRQGLLVYAGGQFYEAGFFPATLVGRSGRGDTCLAAYVAKRLAASPEEATIWAAALTSLKMEAEGPFRRNVQDVERLIRQRYTPLGRVE